MEKLAKVIFLDFDAWHSCSRLEEPRRRCIRGFVDRSSPFAATVAANRMSGGTPESGKKKTRSGSASSTASRGSKLARWQYGLPLLASQVAVGMGSDGENINWAYLGTLSSCPPYLYGVRVVPSPMFFTAGHGGQNILVRGYDRFAPRLPQVGTTIRPSPAVLTDWASYATTAFENGWNPSGGWAPGRSQLVAWGLQIE